MDDFKEEELIIKGFTENLNNVKLIISEVDGVLTNGDFYFDALGNIPFKGFYFKDFEAINLLKRSFKVVFVSSEPSVSYKLFQQKQLPFYYDLKDKKQAVLKVLNHYSVKPDDALYVASTYSDSDCMMQIPMSVCTEDSPPDVKNRASIVLPVYGGDGVFCHLYELLRSEMNRRLR
jgi:3-deoxy-D-manno-octulosonate 8-phosphate phosphatase (KDO 8-P phosphatase)